MARGRSPIRRISRVAKVTDLPCVVVEWRDASIDSEYDGKIANLPQSGVCVNRTIGFLIEITAREVLLVRDVADEDDTVRWPYRIPRVLVTKIIYLAARDD